MRVVQDSRMQCHSQVFEYFSEPEAFHVIVLGGILVVNVFHTCVRNSCRQVLLEALHGTSCVGQVLDIASHTPSIEVRLKDFGTKEVVGSGGVKTMGIVKFELLVVRGRAASIVSIAGYVRENFRTNASTNNKLVEIDGSREHVRSARVCVPACISEVKTNIDYRVVVGELAALN
jgi:hypothetical protein